ncbi:MAG TPA: patatin-like phospholipase family protein [Pyrinomonadaceae bacterium]
MSFPSIGLALSGGAARGLSHVGVLRALHENNIPIDCVAGTSAGSIVGGALAAGMSIDDIETLGRSLRWRHIGRPTVSRRGLQSNKRLESFIRERLPKTKFEELLIPFAAVATDLENGTPVVMRDKGDVAFAIRASCTIPGLYVPVVDSEGRQLVDGGMVAVVPVSAARSLGADIVIAVEVNFEGASFLKSNSIIGVILQSMLTVAKVATRPELDAADYVIQPRVGQIRWDQLKKMGELVDAGYQAGLASIPAIKELIERKTLERSSQTRPALA